MTIYNAKITSTFLGIEDHEIMTFFLHLESGSAGQGYGGYGLDYGTISQDRIPSSGGFGYQAIRHLIETVGVRSWEQLPGKLCRIESDDGPGSSAKILRIGHILEDRWFDLATYMKEKASS